MKYRKPSASAVVAALSVVTVLAFAAPIVRSAGAYYFFKNLVNDTVTAGGTIANGHANPGGLKWTAESTAVINTGRFSRGWWTIRAIPPGGDTTSIIRFAVEIRGHDSLAVDTARTFIFPRYTYQAGAANALDSTGNAISRLNGGNGGDGTAQTLWAGEQEVLFHVARGTNRSSGDFFGWPNGIAIPCQGMGNGDPGTNKLFPYMSLRIRCLSGPAAASGKVRVEVGFVGVE